MHPIHFPPHLPHQLTPLEVAKLELTMAYSINSLFWSKFIAIIYIAFFFFLNYLSLDGRSCALDHAVYLTTQGLSAKEYPVKEELVSDGWIQGCTYIVCLWYLCVFIHCILSIFHRSVFALI